MGDIYMKALHIPQTTKVYRSIIILAFKADWEIYQENCLPDWQTGRLMEITFSEQGQVEPHDIKYFVQGHPLINPGSRGNFIA